MIAVDVDELIDDLGKIVVEVGQARATLLEAASARAALRSTVPSSLPWLGELRFDWRFCLQYSGRGSLRALFRRRTDAVSAVEAQLGFALRPTPAASTQPAAASAPGCRLRVPAILDLPPPSDPTEIRFALAPPHGGVLVVRNAGAGETGAMIEWIRDGESVSALRQEATKGKIHRMGGPAHGIPQREPSTPRLWRLAPFVAWLDSLRAWQLAPERNAVWRPLSRNSAAEAGTPEARKALDAVAEVLARTTRAAAEAPTLPAHLSSMAACQSVENFTATLCLRLKRGGLTLVRQEEEKDMLLLELDCRAAGAGLEIRQRLPDFLAAGALHRSLVDAFLANARSHCFGDYMLGSRKLTFTPETFDRLFAAGRQGAVVLRLGRKFGRKGDIELLMIRGQIEGIEVVALFRGVFEIETRADQENTADAEPAHKIGEVKDFRMLRPCPKAIDPEDVRGEFVGELIQLMRTLHSWGGLLR